MASKKHDSFRVSYTPEEIFGMKTKPPEPKQPDRVGKLLRGVFIGIGLGIAACVLFNSGAYFLPVFGIVFLLGCLTLLESK